MKGNNKMVRLEDILKLIAFHEEVTLYDSGNNIYLMKSEFKDLTPTKYHNWFVTGIAMEYNDYGHEEIMIAICEPCEKE